METFQEDQEESVPQVSEETKPGEDGVGARHPIKKPNTACSSTMCSKNKPACSQTNGIPVISGMGDRHSPKKTNTMYTQKGYWNLIC